MLRLEFEGSAGQERCRENVQRGNGGRITLKPGVGAAAETGGVEIAPIYGELGWAMSAIRRPIPRCGEGPRARARYTFEDGMRRRWNGIGG